MDKKRRIQLLENAMACFRECRSPFSTDELIKLDVTLDECYELSMAIADCIEDDSLLVNLIKDEFMWRKKGTHGGVYVEEGSNENKKGN